SNLASSTKEEIRAYTEAVLELAEGRNPLDVLHGTPTVARRAVEGMSAAQMSMPEREGKWSVRHVLRHLADADIVWSWRMRLVLAQDRPTLTGYDQDAWASRLRYADADPEESLQEFAVLRRGNLRLLDGASPADLKRVGVHSERGEESAELMMRLYAGHDLLHLRQLERIRAAVA
ncbi:MAG: DinB family protein, partial [Longimicrobiales bacterium]